MIFDHLGLKISNIQCPTANVQVASAFGLAMTRKSWGDCFGLWPRNDREKLGRLLRPAASQ